MKLLQITMLAAMLVLSSCSSTEVKEWSQSDTTKEQLAQLQQFAFDTALNYIKGTIVGRGAVSDEFRIQQIIVVSQSRFPTFSKSEIEPIVRVQFAAAKKFR